MSTLSKLRALEAEHDTLPADTAARLCTDAQAREFAIMRADSAISLCERHLATHPAMTEHDQKMYRDAIAEWTAHRDALAAERSEG